jgi:hypothetical protein
MDIADVSKKMRSEPTSAVKMPPAAKEGVVERPGGR